MGRRFTSAENLVNKVCKDIEKAQNQAIDYMVKNVEKDFFLQAQRVMDDYYEEYNPRVYQRIGESNDISGSLRDSYRKLNWRSNGVVHVGVGFDESLMSHPTVTDFGEHYILQNFFAGIHGDESIYQSSISPFKKFNTFYNNYGKKLDKYYEEAKSMFFSKF